MSLFFHQLWGSRETLNVTWRGKKDRIDSIYWRIPAGDSIVFAARTPLFFSLSFSVYLSLSLSLSLPRRHRLDQDVTYRRILFSVDASWKRFAACHFVGLTSFRSSSFPPFRPNTSSPTRNICNTITRFTVKSKYSNAYVFGERNVYTLKRVV